jgi:hypothetical protein
MIQVTSFRELIEGLLRQSPPATSITRAATRPAPIPTRISSFTLNTILSIDAQGEIMKNRRRITGVLIASGLVTTILGGVYIRRAHAVIAIIRPAVIFTVNPGQTGPHSRHSFPGLYLEQWQESAHVVRL